MQCIHDRDRTARVPHRHAFGQFELQILRRQALFLQNRRDLAGEPGMPKLNGGKIHGDDGRRQSASHPNARLPDGGPQDPLADRGDQAAVLGNRDELRRGDLSQFRMRPADQRFRAYQPSIACGNLRLVDQAELAPRQGLPQRAGDLQAAHLVRLQLHRIEGVAVAPFPLDLVHRGIGAAREEFEVPTVERIHGNADRPGHIQLMVLHLVRRRDDIQNPLRSAGRTFFRYPEEQEDELVPAHSGNGVVLSPQCAQPPCQIDQQCIANAMAERVIDVFEKIQVEEHQRKRLALLPGTPEGARGALLQLQAVRQPGQHIEMRQVPDPRFGFLPPGVDPREVCLRLGQPAKNAGLLSLLHGNAGRKIPTPEARDARMQLLHRPTQYGCNADAHRGKQRQQQHAEDHEHHAQLVGIGLRAVHGRPRACVGLAVERPNRPHDVCLGLVVGGVMEHRDCLASPGNIRRVGGVRQFHRGILGGGQHVGLVLGALQVFKLLLGEPGLADCLHERNRPAIRAITPGNRLQELPVDVLVSGDRCGLSVAGIQDLVKLLPVGRIARDHVGARDPGEIVRGLAQRFGDQERTPA
ncbi:hypothetical protein D9M72_359040 [compost metagenome]